MWKTPASGNWIIFNRSVSRGPVLKAVCKFPCAETLVIDCLVQHKNAQTGKNLCCLRYEEQKDSLVTWFVFHIIRRHPRFHKKSHVSLITVFQHQQSVLWGRKCGQMFVHSKDKEEKKKLLSNTAWQALGVKYNTYCYSSCFQIPLNQPASK